MSELLRAQSNVTVTGGDTLLVGGNMRRKGLLISSPKVADIWLNFAGPAAVGVGLCMHPGTQVLVLVEEWVAEGLREEIRACTTGGAENIGVIEFMG
jgi:hypothetical protein